MSAREGARNENAETFTRAAKPLAAAIRAFRQGDHARASAGFASARADLHRIGGSLAQREIVDRSHAAALRAAGRREAARDLLESRLADLPNRGWIQRELARLSAADRD